MRRLDLLLLTALVLLAVLVGRGARELRSPTMRLAPDATRVATRHTTFVSGAGAVSDAAHAIEGTAGSAALDRGEVRRRLQQAEAGTYIGEMLVRHDSSLARWPERSAQPLRVWVQPHSPVHDWRPEFVARAQEAFTSWEETGVPVRFDFVSDSATADVHVTWIDRFVEPISGKTLWARDDRWWIVEGNITLAVHHNEGDPLDESAVRAIAMHEVGHLLGLDHTRDTTTIMAPKVRVRDLSAADRATARLLYTLPPGAVR